MENNEKSAARKRDLGESLALEIAKETAASLRAMLAQVASMQNTLTVLDSRMSNLEKQMEEIKRELRGGDGQEALATRVSILEQGLARAERDTATEKAAREKLEEVISNRAWSVNLALLGAGLSMLVSISVAIVLAALHTK